MSVQAYLVNGVYVRIEPSCTRPQSWYVGMAKPEPFTLPGIELLREPGRVWFEFGPDPAAIVDRLVAEVTAEK